MLLKSPSPNTGSYYIEAGNDKYSVWVRISNHLKPNDDNYEVIKSSGDSRHNWVEINILSTKDFDEAIKYLDVIFLSNPDIRYAKGGEIEFEYLREAEDEEVENFFDSNWQEISRWSEGEGRGTTPHAIYTNGSQDLLEREDYGFDGYNSPQYFFVSINDSFAKGGEINELSGKITRYEDGSAWVDLYDKKGNAVDVATGKVVEGANIGKSSNEIAVEQRNQSKPKNPMVVNAGVTNNTTIIREEKILPAAA